MQARIVTSCYALQAHAIICHFAMQADMVICWDAMQARIVARCSSQSQNVYLNSETSSLHGKAK